MARQWYSNTWVSQEGIPNVLVTIIGSMAGTPLADLVFTLAISRVLGTLRRTLQNDGLLSTLCVNGYVHTWQDVSFVDDTSIPVTGSLEGIIAKTTSAARVAYNVFACYKMPLNFEPGESEAIVHLAGAGKKKARAELTRNENKSSFRIVGGSWLCLRFVRIYKHVGTKLAFDANMIREVGDDVVRIV